MPEFRVIVVPYELGRLRHGVGRGPERLLSGGAVEALASAGADVRVDVVEFDESFERTGYGEVDASFDLIRAVAERVSASASPRARFPCCSAEAASTASAWSPGCGEPSPGVVWLDAHSDFNTPTRRSPATSTGWGWRCSPGMPGRRCTPPCRAHGRCRDGDGAGRGTRLRAAGAGAACRLQTSPRSEPSGMSTPDALLDASVRSSPSRPASTCTSTWTCSTRTSRASTCISAPGGHHRRAARRASIGAVCREFPVRAVSLTVYDPGFDPEGRVPPIAMEVLRRVAAAAVSRAVDLSGRHPGSGYGRAMHPSDEDQPPTPSGAVEPRWPVALAIVGFITISVVPAHRRARDSVAGAAMAGSERRGGDARDTARGRPAR